MSKIIRILLQKLIRIQKNENKKKHNGYIIVVYNNHRLHPT
jgi:metal-responsive CopG/Arc/MetJ family transcriptional regulator